MNHITKVSIISIIVIACTLVFNASFAQQQQEPFGTYTQSQFSDSVVIINWYDPEGMTRLARSRYNEDFKQLAHFFAPQGFGSFCGIASATIILNALRVPNRTAPANPQLAFQLPKVWGGQKGF